LSRVKNSAKDVSVKALEVDARTRERGVDLGRQGDGIKGG
jgi:hypothetical protein